MLPTCSGTGGVLGGGGPGTVGPALGVPSSEAQKSLTALAVGHRGQASKRKGSCTQHRCQAVW